MARQGLVSQLPRFDRSVMNEAFPDAASDPGPARSASSSSSITLERVEEATIAMALRRSRQEISFGCGTLTSARDESAANAAIACGEAQYDAPYSAKPSMKNARIGDDQGAVFGRSSRVIADGYDLTSAPSGLGVRVNPSCTMPLLSGKSTRNARLGTLYSLVTLFAD